MKKLLLLPLLMIGCVKTGTQVDVKNSKDNFEVEFLFKKDNCSVYRFSDVGRHYFTNCTETMTIHSCGKNCTYTENIKGDK